MADPKEFFRHHAKPRGVHVIVASLRPAPRVFMEPVTFIEPVCTAPLQGASAHALLGFIRDVCTGIIVY